MTDEEVIRSFPCTAATPEPGYVTDFIGTKMRRKYLPGNPNESFVEGYPIPASFHATQAEWGGALRAALDADDEISIIELGAGWGPWMVSVGAAARQRGIKKFHFVGVEADLQHHEWIKDHFRDNGFDPAEHQLIHAIVGPRDGFADFPVIDAPSEDWGSKANYSPPTAWTRLKAKLKGRIPVNPGMRRLRCLSLETLLKPRDFVDLVHCDIQGSEAETLAAGMMAMNAKVKRLVVGTHGRDIEQKIMVDMAAHGWILENQEACKFVQAGSKMALYMDGCQTWRNSRFDSRTAQAKAA